MQWGSMCEKALMRMFADLAGMDLNTVANWYSLADMSPAAETSITY